MVSFQTPSLRDLQHWRHQHPRSFLAACLVTLLVLVTFLAHTQDKDPYDLYEAYRQTQDADSYDLYEAHRQSATVAEAYLGTAWQDAPVNKTHVTASELGLAPVGLRQAVQRAEELWKHNVEKRAKFIASKGGISAIHEFADRGRSQDFTLWDVYVPSFPCPWEVERVGRMADGGKYTCGLPRIQQKRGKKCVVYSFGVERESSWEAEILERTDCEIYMYDYSVSEFGPQLREMDPKISSRARFFQYGIGEKDEVIDGRSFYTLTTLMKMNKHDWIDILKVDVEGAEFKVLPDIIAEFGIGRLPFSQLLLEIHAKSTRRAYSAADFGAWWEFLEEAGLRAFSSELNYPAIAWNPYPMAMEMNFLNNCNGRPACGTLLRD